MCRLCVYVYVHMILRNICICVCLYILYMRLYTSIRHLSTFCPPPRQIRILSVWTPPLRKEPWLLRPFESSGPILSIAGAPPGRSLESRTSEGRNLLQAPTYEGISRCYSYYACEGFWGFRSSSLGTWTPWVAQEVQLPLQCASGIP